MSLEEREQLRRRAGNVARAHEDHHVSFARVGGDRRCEPAYVAAPGWQSPSPGEVLLDERGGHSLDRLLARRIDLGEVERVRRRKRGGKVAGEVAGPREQVRLKGGDDAPR